jgi:hypothetical protein
MKPESTSDLRLFNDKAKILLDSSFSEAMLRNQSAFMFEWKEGEGLEVELIGAEGESVDAASWTFSEVIR